MKSTKKPAQRRERPTLGAIRALKEQNNELLAILSDRWDQIDSLRNIIEVQGRNLKKAETFMEVLQADQQKGLARAEVKTAIEAYKDAQATEKAAEETMKAAQKAHAEAVEKLKEAKKRMTCEFWDTVNPPEMVTVRKDQVKGQEPLHHVFELCFPHLGRS